MLESAIQDAVKAATAEWLDKHAEPPLTKRCLTTAETAEYLGVSVNYIHNAVKAGDIVPVNIATGTNRRELRFDIHDLEAWIKRRKGAA